MTMSKAFKTCTNCHREWPTRDDLLSDPTVAVVGYQVNFDELELGFFLFTDNRCGTTLAVPAETFTDLYDGPVHQDRRTGQDDCPGYCLMKEELRPCPAKCECAAIRLLLLMVMHWPKRD